MHAEIAILGGGFAGSLAAILLERIGRKVVLIESARHPRFRIGESSTPVADMMLRRFAKRFDLPMLDSLSRYGDWKQHHANLRVGLKRGFSYFQHHAERAFTSHSDHRNEMLVTASSRDAVADTHWFRADIDEYLFRLAAERVESYEATEVTSLSRTSHGWEAELRSPQETRTARFEFILDATGNGSCLARALGLENQAEQMLTNSFAIYSHFDNVHSWSELMEQWNEGATKDHPFPADAAAQHHLIDEGWLWCLRFDEGPASVGFVLDPLRAASVGNDLQDAEHNFRTLIRRYPALDAMLADARLTAEPGRVIQSRRLQRCLNEGGGDGWAMLPSTVGFVDPLHSTGIGHSLFALARLVEVLEQHWSGEELPKRLSEFGQTIRAELHQIDALVAGCYRALPDFERFTNFAMLYFAAATTFEQRCGNSDCLNALGGFLLAEDSQFRALVCSALEKVDDPNCDFASWLRTAVEPFNTVGLCDPSVQNMYRYTATD